MENVPNNQAAAQEPDNPLDHLTPRNRVFLTLVLDGKKVVEAYKMAGYEGDAHGAYVLKGRLEKELAAMALARGCSKADLLASISRLTELPVVGKDGPVEGISMAHKLRLMGLQLRALESMNQSPTTIMAIQINRAEGAEKKDAIEVDVIKSPLPREGEDQI